MGWDERPAQLPTVDKRISAKKQKTIFVSSTRIFVFLWERVSGNTSLTRKKKTHFGFPD